MKAKRVARMGLAAGAVLALCTIAGPAQAVEENREGAGCAEARPEVTSISGWVSPNACTFIKRQIRFGKVTTPDRVGAYVDLWSKDATLWEPAPVGTPLLQGEEAIRKAISGTLSLIPDFRYRGTRIAVNGPAVMFEAHNEATVKGHEIAYSAVYRVQLTDGGKVVQGRRYYDRHALFLPLAPELPDPFADVADGVIPDQGRKPVLDPDELVARAAAWNDEDAEALVERLTGAPLSAPGLNSPLRTTQGKLAYLKRFFDQVSDVQLQPGQAVKVNGATYLEWHGTLLPEGQTDPVSFGIVERVGDTGGVSSDWTLTFDRLPLVADAAKITELYGRLR
ncbi:nuclear transport factor 2 family protein [Nonomuraea indica]|uniref:nuclear transport factor 2 family protein n=1 Tax=Nonomuraea indica TaxID=1581193 RepID=UPI000C7AE277|nr:nuclear transport factor 2 family protein [Nonomuraea indica]